MIKQRHNGEAAPARQCPTQQTLLVAAALCSSFSPFPSHPPTFLEKVGRSKLTGIGPCTYLGPALDCNFQPLERFPGLRTLPGQPR